MGFCGPVFLTCTQWNQLFWFCKIAHRVMLPTEIWGTFRWQQSPLLMKPKEALCIEVQSIKISCSRNMIENWEHCILQCKYKTMSQHGNNVHIIGPFDMNPLVTSRFLSWRNSYVYFDVFFVARVNDLLYKPWFQMPKYTEEVTLTGLAQIHDRVITAKAIHLKTYPILIYFRWHECMIFK